MRRYLHSRGNHFYKYHNLYLANSKQNPSCVHCTLKKTDLTALVLFNQKCKSVFSEHISILERLSSPDFRGLCFTLNQSEIERK